jgi:hypothetical protein
VRIAAIKKASVAQLLGEYEEAALAHRAGSRTGEYKKANAAYHRLAAVLRELRSRGPEAHSALLRLLEDPRLDIRGWVAAHALEMAPERAEKVLEAIAAGPHSLARLSAEMVLQEWRGGRLKFP